MFNIGPFCLGGKLQGPCCCCRQSQMGALMNLQELEGTDTCVGLWLVSKKLGISGERGGMKFPSENLNLSVTSSLQPPKDLSFPGFLLPWKIRTQPLSQLARRNFQGSGRGPVFFTDSRLQHRRANNQEVTFVTPPVKQMIPGGIRKDSSTIGQILSLVNRIVTSPPALYADCKSNK